jgi:anion-transporting  ArsA/GET3 family ATPase
MSAPLAAALSNARVIACAGPGGVGKTTTSAALALRAARMGRRTLVLTIDPAKRLADALGLEALGAEPHPVEAEGVPHEGLWAMMLDVRAGLDRLVGERISDPAETKKLHENRLFQLLRDAMAGMQEYIAVDRLYDLHASGKFDLILLDTPPSTHALDFLDASKRLARLFDRRIIRWLLPAGKAGLGRLFSPGAAFTKLLGAVLGEGFVHDLVEFFGAAESLIDPFQQRGDAIRKLLLGPETAFVLVTAPEPRRIEESLAFAKELDRHGQKPVAFIVNRTLASTDLDHPVESVAHLLPDHPASRDRMLGDLERYRRALTVQAERERATCANLVAAVGRDAVRLVPHLGEDVADLATLGRLADEILPPG